MSNNSLQMLILVELGRRPEAGNQEEFLTSM